MSLETRETDHNVLSDNRCPIDREAVRPLTESGVR